MDVFVDARIASDSEEEGTGCEAMRCSFTIF
jgi:hypothetical protein